MDNPETIKTPPPPRKAEGKQEKRGVLGGVAAQNTPKIPFLEWL
jgi:hypothetical protein